MRDDRFHTAPMKANRRSRAPILLAAVGSAVLAASCSDTRIVPTATPTPTVHTAPLRPGPPVAPPPPRSDWRNVPVTPGEWSWGLEGGRSVARFAGGALTLRCDRANGTVTLLRAGTAAAPEPMTVTTTSSVRTLTATPQPGSPPALAVALRASDPLLDAMIFSRGRFVIDVPGLPPLYAPSWPEVSRVVEDCR